MSNALEISEATDVFILQRIHPQAKKIDAEEKRNCGTETMEATFQEERIQTGVWTKLEKVQGKM